MLVNDDNFLTFLSDLGEEPEINEDEQGGGLFYTFKSLGIEIQFLYVDPYEILSTIFLFSGAKDDQNYHDGYKRYMGLIPEGLTFTMSRADVQGKIGSPSSTGEPAPHPYLTGIQPAWDKFDLGKYEMVIQYLPDGKGIYLIILSLPDSRLSRLHERE